MTKPPALRKGDTIGIFAPSSRTDSLTLQSCMEAAYTQTTQLPYHANTITPHMTDYHAFRTLPEGVPAIIIEVGFMNLDRALLTTNADIPAAGILNGIPQFMHEVVQLLAAPFLVLRPDWIGPHGSGGGALLAPLAFQGGGLEDFGQIHPLAT